MRIPGTRFFGQTFRPYILLFAEIWQGSGGHVVFQNRPKIYTKQAIFRLYKSASTHLCQPFKSTKKKRTAFYNLPYRAYRPAGDKNAVELVKNHKSLGFFSQLFLVPKPNSRWRPILDLSNLKNCLRQKKF